MEWPDAAIGDNPHWFALARRAAKSQILAIGALTPMTSAPLVFLTSDSSDPVRLNNLLSKSGLREEFLELSTRDDLIDLASRLTLTVVVCRRVVGNLDVEQAVTLAR